MSVPVVAFKLSKEVLFRKPVMRGTESVRAPPAHFLCIGNATGNEAGDEVEMYVFNGI